jgi:hypothetical protein
VLGLLRHDPELLAIADAIAATQSPASVKNLRLRNLAGALVRAACRRLNR